MAGKLKDLYVKRNQNQYQPAADSWEARAAELSNMSGGAMPQGETAGNGVFGWLKDSADAGFFSTLGGTARLAGEFMPFGNDTFNSWADKADEIARRNSPQPGQNLEGADYIASAVGNALGSGGASALEAGVVAGLGSLLGVGGVAGAALGGASKVIPGVGKAVQAGKTLWGSPMGKYLVANVAGSPFEAASESGNLISDMRKENQQGTANYTDDEIRDAAIRSGALNLAWLTGMNMLEAGTLGKITGALGGNMAAKGVKDIAKRATLGGLSSGIGEGAEEYGQNLIGDYSKRGNTADFNYDEALEAAKLGAIGGGVLGGVGSGLSATFSKNNSDVAEEIASEDGGTIEEAPEATVSGKEAFINAIAGQESGGNYNAENGDTGAYGKYQIMPSNWPSWAEEAGIGADAPRTPENQEIVARFKLGQYYDKYGARGAAIAWYGGEGALNYSEEALNRKQGDNGEYPSINEYADEVLGRMGNVADSVRIDDTIDDTEENYFDNYTDDTIPDSLNPVRGFDVSHLDKGTAQDRNSLLYGERVKKAKPAPASEEVASFNQILDSSNAQKAPNSLFANSRRSWDAAERIYKARAKEQAERKARAQAIVNIANAQQQSFLNVLRNRAAQQWDNAEQEYKDRKQDKLQSLANVINARAAQKWDAKEADNVQKAKAEQEKQAQLQNIARLLDARAAQQWDNAERDANLKQNQAQALANLLNAKAAGQYDVAQQVYANRAKEQAEKQRQQQAIANIINARAAQKFDEAETADKFKFVPQRQSMYDGAMRRNLAAQDKVKPEEQPSVEPTGRNGAALDKRNMLDVTLPKVREQHKWDKEHKEYHAERYGESALPQTQLLSTDRAARRNMPKPGIEARSFINDRAEKKSARERMQDAIAFVWKDDPKHPLKACRRQLNMFRDMRKEYLQPIYDVMAEGAGNGVSRIPIIEFDNQHRGRFYRQSNNSPWYAKYFKEHKKKPTQKAMYDIAEEVAFGENADVGYYAGVQGKELEAIVAENHAQLDPINDYIQTYESLELRLKENPNYGKEQAERINKAEEARRAEKRNAGETASAESIQTEAKQPAESKQDEVKETAEQQEKPEPRDLFFTVKSNGKEEDNVIIVYIMPVKEPKYQQTIKKLIDAGWKKAETNTIPNVALGQYYAPATEENYNFAKGLTNKAVGYNLMGGQPGGWDYMQGLLDHEAEERRKADRTLGEILEDEGITADITVDDNQSITIEFSKKPSDEVRQSVKEAGYKWRDGAWKSKVNERSMEIAKELGYNPAEKAETEQGEKLNLPKGTTVDVSIVGDNSNIIQVKFNGAHGKGTGGIMGRAGYKWKSDKQVWQARKTEKALDVAEQLGYTEEETEQEIVERLKKHIGESWKVFGGSDESITDVVKVGDQYVYRTSKGVQLYRITDLQAGKSAELEQYKADEQQRISEEAEKQAKIDAENNAIKQESQKKLDVLEGFASDKSDFARTRIANILNKKFNYEGYGVQTRADFVKLLLKDGYSPDIYDNEYYLSKGKLSQQITKTEYDFANYLLEKQGKGKIEPKVKAKPSADTFSKSPDALFNSEDKSQQTDKYKNYSKKAKKQQNQGKQEYKYYLNARPADIGAVPKGFIRVDTEDNGGRYGAIYYDRQLSDKEVQQYELKSDADVEKEKQTPKKFMSFEAVDGNRKRVFAAGAISTRKDRNGRTLPEYEVDEDTYQLAKEYGGYKDGLVAGVAFKDKEARDNFVEDMNQLATNTAEETTDKLSKNNKTADKQEAKQQKSNYDYGDKKAILKDLLAATGLKEKNSKVEDVEGLDYSDAGLEEALNELAKECSKLSANPMFNPALYRAAAKVGLIFLKRTGRNFKRWAKALLDWFRKNSPEEEKKIKPFLGAIYKNIENWPKDLKFKEDIVELSCRLVGSSYAEGNTSFEAVYKDISEMAGVENAQALRGYLEQAYLAVDELENPTLTIDENVVESKQDKGGSQYDFNSTESLFSDDTGSRRAENEIRTTSSSEESSGSNGQGSRTLEGQSGRNGNNGVPGSRTAVGGKTSVREGGQEASSTDSDASGSTGLSNSVVDSLQEQPNVNEGAVKNIIKSASDGRVDATDEVTQKVNEVIKENDLDKRRADRLRQTANVMPFLTAIQLHNTDFVAERFDTNGKQGVMITDGTGTGKTFSGLAIVKKMVDEGKKNIIIAAPNDTIINQWINAARDFYKLEVTRLKDTDDAGEGIVITTYANFGENEELVNRNWDMVICDESHNLMNSEGGKTTNILSRLRLLTYHPTELRNRAEQTILSEDKIEARKIVRKALALKTKEPDSLSAKERSIISASERIQANSEDKLTKEETAQIEAQAKEWEELNESEKPKVMFLSATPFAYVNDIDYANGYLFDYPKLEGQGYNQPNGLQQFLMEHFGYRMRSNKLTKPDGSVDNALMEMEFHEWLRNTGALTGHELEIDKDYNRGFILVDQGVGRQIDEGFEFLRENKEKYGNLEEVLNKQFDGRRRNYLLESIKARASVPIIREYLKAGKKVVVFHETNVERESFNPFRFTKKTMDVLDIGGETAQQIKHEWELFAKARPDLVNLNLDELSEPRRIYEEAFGDEAMFFNGRVPKKNRAQYVAAFNNDNSGKNLIIVQQDAGNAGISLHDTTGKYPRVEVNINIPRRPSFMIQIDGRIYRLGCMSNAIIRYLTTGTNIENHLFASTVAGRTSTAENLALGRKARGLRDSIIDSYQKTLDGTWVENLPGAEGEDVGGKESDRNMITSASDYDRAKGLYYGRGKKTAKTKAAEGVDYFATPEPIGYKMVQWANVKAGDKILEPSAGHGAISRFFSPTTENTIIEPSSRLAPQAQMNTENAKLINGMFEDLHISNKYDAITMNPPFGTGGKTAIEHLSKAFRHLREGGRVIALIPRGGMADKRFTKWYESDEAKNAHMVGEVLLPNVTFERAGTKVATRIVIIDKGGESQGVKRIDLSRINNINELFDNLESVEMPARQTKQADAGIANFANSLRKGDAEGNSEVVTADSYKHTKTGEIIPSAKLNANLSDEEYRKVKSIAGKNGGYYSRYAKAFLFQDNEIGRDKFVEEVNGANNTQYSVSSEAVQRAKEEVEAEIRAAFPNGKVEYVNGVPTITMPNGSKFQYSIRENIVVNAKEQRKADAAHGTSGARVQGFWKKFTGNGVQRMLAVSQNSERGTAFHEAMHAAIDLVLTEKEKNALYNYYEKKAKEQKRDVDEVIADAYRDWVLARQRKSGTMFGKLWRKVKDFCTRIKAIFDKGAEVERIMQNIESGRVYERGTNNHSVTKRISFSEETHYSVASPKHKIANAFTNTERKGVVDSVKDFFKEHRKSLYQDWFDKNNPLKGFDALTKATGGLSVYDQVQSLPATTAGMLKALTEGTAQHIKMANQHLKNVKMKYNVTLAMALEKIDKNQMDKAYPKYLAENGFDNWVNALGAYLGAERCLEMARLARAEGKTYKFPKGLAEQECQEFVKKAPQQFKAAADIFYKVNDNVISIMEDAEVFSHDLAKTLRTKYRKYCPLLRDFSDTAAADSFIGGLTEGGRGIGNVSVPLKRINIEGSERGVLNPLETILKSYAVMLNRAERNKVALMAVENSRTADLHELIQEVPGTTADPKNCVFTVLINGKKKAYKTTQDLYGPIVGYNLPAANLAFGVARTAARMLRTGATMSPSFILRNVLRDTVFAGIASKNGFIPIVDTIRGAIALAKDPAMRAEFEAAGVTEYNFYSSQKSRIKSLDAMAGETPASAWEIIKAVFSRLEATSDFFESSTRMGEYMKARQKGLSMEEAARAAREVTLDFSRSGRIGEQVNQVVPFFNACLQGGDKMVRLFREDFVGTSLKVLKYIVLPSLLIMAMNWDEDWYKDLDPDIKNNYWCLGRNIRIPKPQEAGVLFGSGIEALFQQAADKDKDAVSNFLKAFSSNMMPSVLPTLILPLIEWSANYSFFKGRPLVGNKYSRLPDELQYNDYTSELSKGIGSTLKVSPMKIDNLVRGYTGTMGALLWSMAGEPFAKANNLPAKHFSELPFVRDFNVTDANLSRPMNEFYGILDKANRQHAGYGVKGKPEAAVKGIRSAGSMISKIRKDIDKITHSNLTPERKRELIDKRKEKMNQIAKQATARYGKYFE